MHSEKIRILFIENDHWLQDSLNSFFEKNGYSLDILPTGEKGIRKLEEDEFDVIVADHVLPGMSGIEFMMRIRNISAIKILIAGYSSQHLIDAGETCGVDLFYRKPFNMEVLEQNMLDLFHSRVDAEGY